MLWHLCTHMPTRPQNKLTLTLLPLQICGWLEIEAGNQSSPPAPTGPPKPVSLNISLVKRFSLKLLFRPPPLFETSGHYSCHLIRKIRGENPQLLTTYYLRTFPLFFQLKPIRKPSHLRIITEPSAEPTWLGGSVPLNYLYHP